MSAVSGSPARGPRRPRVPRTDRMTTVWLCLALVAAVATILVAGRIPQPLWTMVHVLTLGVLTNGILQWSWYFARALAHLGPADPKAGRRNTWRIASFNAALVLLTASMWTGWLPGTHLGATAVGLVAAWHGYDLLIAAKSRLASRFIVVLRFYQAAALFLVLTASLAGLLTAGMFSASAPAWLVSSHDALVLAHAILGVGGWIGLTVGGTLVTLGPTALRTRMHADAVPLALKALPVWIAGLLVAATSAALSLLPGIGAGLLLVLGAIVYGIALPLVRSAAVKGPREYASWSMAAGLAWILLGVAALAVNALRAASATDLRAADLDWLVLAGVGGVGQLFIGALSYLMPVVIGGGPSVVRLGVAAIERFAPAREAARNAALALLALLALGGTSVPGAAAACRLVLAATFALDLVLLARAGIAQSRASRARAEQSGASHPVPAPLPRPAGATPLLGSTRAPGASDSPAPSQPPNPFTPASPPDSRYSADSPDRPTDPARPEEAPHD